MTHDTLGYADPDTGRASARVRALLRFKSAAPYVVAIATVYVVSYAALSASGRYEPVGIDPRGVTGYRWSPAGFTHNYRLRTGLVYAYLPLYLVDCNWWHKDDDAWTGRYPTHVPATLGEVEAAWRRAGR